MDEHARNAADAGHHAGASGEDDDPEFSLKPHLETLWRSRHVIAASLLVVSAFLVVIALAAWIWSPTERVASLPFRLLFDGAERRLYPNGSPFSPAEIVGAPVLTAVFKNNNLQRFGQYEDFKAALFVQQAGAALDQLTREYEAKLADTRMQRTERTALEAEYTSRRESMSDPSFAVRLRRNERFRQIPAPVTEKLLNDVLATWALQAEQQKGVLRYQVPLRSARGMSRKFIDDNDYLFAIEALRSYGLGLISTIDELEKLPGAITFRPTNDMPSLPDIRMAVENCIGFELDPLLGIIRAEGITRNARELELYATSRISELGWSRKAIQERVEHLRRGLHEYLADVRMDSARAGAPADWAQSRGIDAGAVNPLVKGLIERIDSLAAGSIKGEMEYRRQITDRAIAESERVADVNVQIAKYQELVGKLRSIGDRPNGPPALAAKIEARGAKALDLIAKSADQLATFHQELSAHNLGPATRLFVVTGPFVDRTLQSFSFKAAATNFAFLMMLTVILTAAGCLIRDATRRKQRT